MEKQKIGIQKFLLRHMVFIALLSFGLLTAVWIYNEYSVFSSESKLLREEYLRSQKAMLRSEVNNVADYVEYMKAQTEGRLKSELQGRVHEAIGVATNIYQENAATRSLDEIKKMVKDALRPIRFLNGRGYYFAFSMDGIEALFADRPEMEGVNMFPVQGARGEYVVKDMIDIVKKRQEGFYQYTWTKPSREGKYFPKIAFVKYFKPFDWAIATGEYLDDFTDQIQDAVLERIVGLRFGDEGYFFGSMDGGYPLFTNGKITKGTKPIWDMTDPEGVKIIQEQQKASKNPDGGFIQYSWHKLGSPNPSPKISFVRGIPGWGWAIGAGVYLDTIEKIIAQKEVDLRRGLIKKIVVSTCMFTGLIVLICFWAKHVAGQTRKSMKMFESFFEKAATEFVAIPASEMQFRELSRIAVSANKMIETQKRYEEALRDSEERFRELFNHMSAGVAIYESPDNGQRFLFKDLNLFALENAQRKKEEVVGREVREVFPGVEALGLFDVFKRVWKTGNPEHHPSTLYKDNKLMLWVENYVCKLPSGELVAIYEDTTAKKKAEEERESLERQLLQTQKLESIGTLAGGIAHDFNNILGAVMGYSELALMETPRDSKAVDNIQEVLKAGRRAKEMVKQILTFARQSTAEVKPIQVKYILNEALRLLHASMPRSIEFRQTIESDAVILADPTQIHQLIMNLCTNAAHSMEDDVGILTVQLKEISLDSSFTKIHPNILPGSYLQLSVEDTGCGMSPDILEKIFDPYFTTKEVGEGTGLGLSVVKGIVDGYDGVITVKSEMGKGSAFAVYFPIIDPKSEKLAAKSEEEEAPTGNEAILFIDDEDSIARLNEQVLTALGYRVTMRVSTLEALELFKSDPGRFDLVITDMTMPQMTGDLLALEMKKIRPDIPLILCTGYSKRMTDERAKAIGISAFLMKPVVRLELAKTVRKVLDESI